MSKIPAKKNRAVTNEMMETEQALRKLQPKNPHVRKMIDLAIKGLYDNVPRMSSEEIFAYLGRNR
jgi:hypothetical protein